MILKQAKEVLQIEADGILAVMDRLDENFAEMVDLIYRCKGRVIMTGIGKSGIVARKIVATLNSTGTRSLFLHPVEAMHGDLGMVSSDDIVIALSNSGETDELNMLVPSLKRIGCTVIAFTGQAGSTLGRQGDIVIDVAVDREACPMGLAPTASTTALLAVGDALAVTLIRKRHFRASDFKQFHPGGSLGQRLTLKVGEIMLTGKNIPKVGEGEKMRRVIQEINRLQLGAALVVKKGNILVGIVTDGDIRRHLMTQEDIYERPVEEVMTSKPKTASPDSLASQALSMMEKNQITVLPIVNPVHKVRGILHLHDILGKGAFRFNGG
ncbi:MAG: KpsF/GutQ family sugar-phosphate isomerase [Thermodesulfobacteriota bacterium]|nr:KpsF/GutQ family sugar-phosphate isomerase [Thermodesulfobacteriota bacterium]